MIYLELVGLVEIVELVDLADWKLIQAIKQQYIVNYTSKSTKIKQHKVTITTDLQEVMLWPN